MHRIFTPLAVAVCLSACSESTPSAEQTPPKTKAIQLFADSYPVAYFSSVILGERGNVTCPVPPGEDPITWFPDDSTLEQMQAADRVILNGAEFTKWPKKVSLTNEKMVVSTSGFNGDFIRYENAVTHTHGDSEHTHEGIDGHTWMSPGNMRQQAATIFEAIDPLLPDECMTGYGELNKLIEELDTQFKEITLLLGEKPLLASHPAYNYIAAEYGWNIKNLDLDPEAPLDTATFATITEAQASHPATILLWESAPLEETASKLESKLGLESIVFSPCETQPETNFAEVMRANLSTLKKTLKK